jgi:hypothetical protein
MGTDNRAAILSILALIDEQISEAEARVLKSANKTTREETLSEIAVLKRKRAAFEDKLKGGDG